MGNVVPIMGKNVIDCDLDYGASYITLKKYNRLMNNLQSLSNDAIKEGNV